LEKKYEKNRSIKFCLTYDVRGNEFFSLTDDVLDDTKNALPFFGRLYITGNIKVNI
jgi:hypothetical protein